MVSRLNLASFVTTWMEPECDELVSEARNVNYIDEAEYPSTTAIQNECALPQHLFTICAAVTGVVRWCPLWPGARQRQMCCMTSSVSVVGCCFIYFGKRSDME